MSKQSGSGNRPKASRMSQESQDEFKQRRDRLYGGYADEVQPEDLASNNEGADRENRRRPAGERQERTRRIPVQMTDRMVELAEAISRETEMEFGDLLSQVLKNALSVYADRLNIRVKKRTYVSEFRTEDRKPSVGKREGGDRGRARERGQFGDRGRSGEGRKFGDRSSSGEGKEFGDRARPGEGKKFGDRNRSGQTGQRGKFGERDKFGDRNRPGQGGKFGDRKRSGGARKPGNRQSGGGTRFGRGEGQRRGR